MKRALLALGVTFGVALVALFAFLIYVLLASGDASYWEGEIADFERRDVSNPPPENAVLFVGGRDVRLWTTLAEDMAPVPVIGRASVVPARRAPSSSCQAMPISPMCADADPKTCLMISERFFCRCAQKV